MKRIALACGLLILVALEAPAQQVQQSVTTANQSAQVNFEETNDELLIKAIESGDLARVIKLLDAGAGPNATDDGTPAIVLAVRLNHAEIAEALLSRKAKADQLENDDTTALQVAASAGRSNLVKLLIAHGADVNLSDHDGHTALMCAAIGAIFKSAPSWLVKSFFGDDVTDELLRNLGSEHLECAKLLLRAGAHVNAQGADCGTSALMVAAMGGSVELTKLLLEHHADVNLSNGEYTALKFAEMFESPKDLQEELGDKASAEDKQALTDWGYFTAPRRTLVAGMLRQAGAK